MLEGNKIMWTSNGIKELDKQNYEDSQIFARIGILK